MRLLARQSLLPQVLGYTVHPSSLRSSFPSPPIHIHCQCHHPFPHICFIPSRDMSVPLYSYIILNFFVRPLISAKSFSFVFCFCQVLSWGMIFVALGKSCVYLFTGSTFDDERLVILHIFLASLSWSRCLVVINMAVV